MYGISYVIFKKCVALISALMLLIVGMDEKNLPSPDGAEVISRHRYVLEDYYMSNQGVTNDGTYYYFSGKKNLGKARMSDGEIFLINTSPIPKELKALGCDHIGGLTCYDGIVYAAIEDGPDYLHPFIVLYDAQTLKFTGKYYELPQSLHIEGVPWCAFDAQKQVIYTAEWSNAAVLNVFSIDGLKLIETIPLSEPVDRIQGAEMYGRKLYMSSDEENDLKRVFSVDVDTGEVKTEFTRNIGKEFEAEDLTVYEGENGPVICVLDRGARRKSMNLTKYIITG
ncbi:MAG: hypothetical protein K6B52_03675 [Clostridiales bacterium]|nr:hypothetical protein [Clostridiales bacterium]